MTEKKQERASLLGKPPGAVDDSGADFELDLEIDIDLSMDDPLAVPAAPTPAAEPAAVGARPDPRLAPPPRQASSKPRYQASRRPPPPRYQRGGGSDSPRLPTPPSNPALSTPEDPSEGIPSGDLAHVFASGDPLAFGVEITPDELPQAELQPGFDPWADALEEDDENPLRQAAPAAGGFEDMSLDFSMEEEASLSQEVSLEHMAVSEDSDSGVEALAQMGFGATEVSEDLSLDLDGILERGQKPGQDAPAAFENPFADLMELEDEEDEAPQAPAASPGAFYTPVTEASEDPDATVRVTRATRQEAEQAVPSPSPPETVDPDATVRLTRPARQDPVSSPNSRPTLNFKQVSGESLDSTLQKMPQPELLEPPSGVGFEPSSKLSGDGLGDYGRELLEMGSGFEDIDLEELEDLEDLEGLPAGELSLDLGSGFGGSFDFPWSGDAPQQEGDTEARPEDPFTFDRGENTLRIPRPDLEHISSGAVDVEISQDPSQPELPSRGPLAEEGGLQASQDAPDSQSSGFGVVRRRERSDTRTPPPASRPMRSGAMRRSPTFVDPEYSRKLERAQVLRRGGLHEEAARILEELQGIDPNNSQLRHLMQLNEQGMSQKFLVRLGNLEASPRLTADPGSLMGLGLDSRAGYLLTLIDGMSTYQDILELSPMSDEETAELLVYLLRENVIRHR